MKSLQEVVLFILSEEKNKMVRQVDGKRMEIKNEPKVVPNISATCAILKSDYGLPHRLL